MRPIGPFVRAGGWEEANRTETEGTGTDEWAAHGDIPAAVVAACRQEVVIVALAAYFPRNSRDANGARRVFATGEPEALARHTVERLLAEDTFMVADVGGMRFHLTYGTDVYPADTVIHVNAWDDDDEVWRLVGQVRVSPAA